MLDFNKNTAFIISCFCLFDLNIKISQHIIQWLIYSKTKARILSYIKIIVFIHYLDISNLQDFFFQPYDISFVFSVYFIYIDIVYLKVKKI